MPSDGTQIFARFLQRASPLPIAIVASKSADGLAASAMAQEALSREGFRVERSFFPARGENPYGQKFLVALASSGARAYLWLDLGAREKGIMGDSPALFIDDHDETSSPEARTLFGGGEAFPLLQADPDGRRLSTGGILFENLRREFSVEDLRWLAEVSACAGEEDGTIRLDEEPLVSRVSDLREIVTLLNASHRSKESLVNEIVVLLRKAAGPGRFLKAKGNVAARLHQAREEVKAEVSLSSHVAPIFMWRVALVPFSSPCLVEGVLAARWERMLSDYVVIASNFFLGETVTFSAKTLTRIHVVRFLRGAGRGLGDEFYVLGHPHSASGSATLAAFKVLLKRLRFRGIDEVVERGRRPLGR